MNLVLHHFLKEFRYLRLRWLAFLALLAFELAVNLEWLFPQWQTWLEVLPWAWVILAAGVLSGCPEDCPADERHFSGTRPVAKWQYWMMRGLVFVVLVLLPVVLQNGAYLMLSGRPVTDVLRGMLERGIVVIGLGAWFVPVQALWARREGMSAWVSKVAVMALCVELLPLLTRWLDPPGRMFLLPLESFVPACLCLAVAMSLLVAAHQRYSLSLRLRLGLSALIVTSVMLISLYWPLITHPQGDQQPELVKQHADKLHITPKLTGDVIEASRGEQQHYMRLPMEMKLDVPGLHTTLHTLRTSVMQTGREISLPQERYETTPYGFDTALFEVDSTLAGFFPPETLLIRTKGSHQWPDERPNWQDRYERSYLVGRLGPQVDETQPLRIETDFLAQWWQREIIADFTCEEGVVQEHADGYRWQILGVGKHLLDAETKQGAITVQIHLQKRTHWFRQERVCYLLYSPQRRVAWLVPEVQEARGVRGASTGWQRSSLTLAWKDILNHADGEDARVDPAHLRIMVFRGREIGTTAWTWQSPELRVRAHEWHPSQRQSLGWSSLYSRDANAFRKRLSTLKPITATSSDAEVRRYLYDVFTAHHRANFSDTPESKAAIREAYLPLAKHHMAHLLRLPEQYAPELDEIFAQVVSEHLTDEHRETVIDLLPEHPHLIEIVMLKGWAKAAQRVQTPFLAAKGILHNHHYADLLLAWGDEVSHETLLREFSGYGHEFGALARMPAWRPRLEEKIRQERERQILVMPGDTWSIDCAANLGDAHAFDLCMRVMGNDPFPGSGSSDEIPPIPNILGADGKLIWQSEDEVANTLRFRHRTSADFIYVPEKLAWRVKP